MEYIQCESCHKKYGVNDKIRAAVGRTITCKACGQKFEISIFETPDHQSNQQSNSEPHHSQKEKLQEQNITEQQTFKETSRPSTNKKHFARRLAPSAILGVAIIVLSGYFFYLDRQVDIGQPFVPTQNSQSIKPMLDNRGNPIAQQNQQSTPSTKQPHKIIPKHSLSQACKEVSARQWLNDFTMMHGMPSSAEYVRMLDQGTQNTAQIRKLCGGSHIVQELLSTAKKGEPPIWLVDAIQALTAQDKKSPHF